MSICKYRVYTHMYTYYIYISYVHIKLLYLRYITCHSKRYNNIYNF